MAEGGVTLHEAKKMKKPIPSFFVVTVLAFAVCSCGLIGPRPPTHASIQDT